MTSSPHLWVALSPHGYGHAAMTAPLVAELRRRRPELRLTIQTALPREFLATRYGEFEQVTDIPDFGFRMRSATDIDLEASADGYAAMHVGFDGLVAREAERLRRAAPDLVLANVPYVTVAAAALVGIPVAAFSSLNWADMYAHYLGHRPEAPLILGQMRESYAKAAMFLRCTPAQTMTLPNLRDIGVVARRGAARRDELAQTVGTPRIGLIAFGGIDHSLPLEKWPVMEGWTWLSTLADTPERADILTWQSVGMPFADLIPSVDVIVTKPGYGTFTEAGLAGTPVLCVPRPDWPECPHLDNWLAAHVPVLPVSVEELLADLPLLLQRLFSLPRPQVAEALGVVEGADALEALLGPSE
ncbi:MAG TPA: hypothetical protein VLL76_00865 [Candidatus Omnitrophota bacterium]|nr:hypothetical protein [Candidatus Omnitrophota bacterium]